MFFGVFDSIVPLVASTNDECWRLGSCLYYILYHYLCISLCNYCVAITCFGFGCFLLPLSLCFCLCLCLCLSLYPSLSLCPSLSLSLAFSLILRLWQTRNECLYMVAHTHTYIYIYIHTHFFLRVDRTESSAPAICSCGPTEIALITGVHGPCKARGRENLLELQPTLD